jgi:hypothetical protein
MKYIVAFGLFWWDFIVGDSMLLAIGSIVTIVAAWLVAESSFGAAAEFLLPAGVLLTLVAALRNA